MAKTTFIDGDSSQGIMGTILLAAWLNLVFNHRHTGQDADGFAPKIDLNEVTDAILARLVPAGTIIHTAAVAAPTGYLAADGSAVSRTTYASLFAAIGTTYGAGDGSATFNLPDLRGEFIRGWDGGRGVDNGRVLGSGQADSFKTHNHMVPRDWKTPTQLDALNAGLESGGTPDNVGSSGGFDFMTVRNSDGGGTETRPRNVALLACIKY